MYVHCGLECISFCFPHPQNFSDTLIQVLSTTWEDGARKVILFFPTTSLIKRSKWGRAIVKANCLIGGSIYLQIHKICQVHI